MMRHQQPHSLSHQQARALVAERLDWPLAEDRAAALESHLEGCPACRAVEAQHRAARVALHQLSQPAPPRDLPARTLAALDLEAGRLRWARPTTRLRSSPQSGAGLAFASLVSIGLAVVVGTLLLVPGGLPSPTAPVATPFAIAPEQLAYLRVHGDEVTLFRTSLDRVCPPDSLSCANLSAGVSQVVSLPKSLTVSGLTLDPAGRRGAIAGRSGDRTTFYVFDLVDVTAPAALPPYAVPSIPGTPASLSASPLQTHPAHTLPAVKVGTASSKPSPSRSPGPSASDEPAGTRRPEPSASPAPAVTESPTGVVALASGTATAAPSDQSLPPARARAILTDVLPAGMPPAWSADGSTLAFSAVAAGGTGGPDIYLWHPGEDVAVALTTDHASAFASWAGTRIVGSTATTDATDPLHALPVSFVIDPATGERRDVASDGVWLPSVDPTGRFVVFWSGDLETTAGTAMPGRGALLFGSWAALDPFAEGALPAASSLAPAETAAVPIASPSPGRRRAEPTETPRPTVFFGNGESVTMPLEASPDAAMPPVRDWLIAWSADGSAFGTWVGDSPGTDIGILTVQAVDVANATIDRQTTLLAATPANRAFSCGQDRVAWTTPTDSSGRSELRIVVWGSFGRGELRSRDPEERDLLPAF
jgi:anti-sigma factor RsiW